MKPSTECGVRTDDDGVQSQGLPARSACKEHQVSAQMAVFTAVNMVHAVTLYSCKTASAPQTKSKNEPNPMCELTAQAQAQAEFPAKLEAKHQAKVQAELQAQVQGSPQAHAQTQVRDRHTYSVR